jgi:hypothetical protein
MIKDLGELGTYQQKQSQFVLKTPGRKYNKKKEDQKLPRDYLLNDFDPKDVRLGDLIAVSEERRGDSYIVSLDSKKHLVLVKLPIDGSGYGIIPLSVSSHFKNAINAFKDAVDIKYIKLSPKDEGLKQYFFKNDKVLKKYNYEYWVNGDELIISDPNSKKSLSLSKQTFQLLDYKPNKFINKFFDKKPKETLNIRVSVGLNDSRNLELKQLYKQSQENDQLYDKYIDLRKKYMQQKQHLAKSKDTKFKKILLQNNIVSIYNGGGYQSNGLSYTYYKLNGTKKSLQNVFKQLTQLNQNTQSGKYQIKKKLKNSL